MEHEYDVAITIYKNSYKIIKYIHKPIYTIKEKFINWLKDIKRKKKTK